MERAKVYSLETVENLGRSFGFFYNRARARLAFRTMTLKYNSRRTGLWRIIRSFYTTIIIKQKNPRGVHRRDAYFRNGQPTCAILSLARRAPRSRHYPLRNEIAHGTRYLGVLLVRHGRVDLERVSKNITRLPQIIGKRERKDRCIDKWKFYLESEIDFLRSSWKELSEN